MSLRGRCYARRSLSSSTRSTAGGVEPSIELTAEGLWSEVSGRLRGALNETTYRTWFDHVEGLELNDDQFVLAVPNDFTRDWIEGHFIGLIRAAVGDTTGHERQIQLSVKEAAGEPPAPVEGHHRESLGIGLNAKYTFDSFVIGSSNRFAHAAALAVAEAPAQAYNPLFIYGGTGLGKTHLLQAIAQYVAEHQGELSVRYVTSETFMNDFINALRDKRIEGFKQRYRAYDLLLIDDIQFFEHKERIQEEFFHTFNSIYEAGGQIVISSDRPPKRDLDPGGAAALTLRVGPDHRHPAARPRDADRDPAQEGEDRPHPRARSEGARVHRRPNLVQHPRARRRADARGRLLLADRAADDRGPRPGRAQGRLPARRGASR